MANHFGTHHKAAGKAFAAGNHAQAMHHIGHMMMATRNAMKGGSGASGSPAPTGAPQGPDASQAMGAATAGSDDDIDDAQNPAGVATPAPMPAKGHFFGQFAKASPSPAPHKPGAGSPLTATNHAPSGGFNKARFSSLRSQGR